MRKIVRTVAPALVVAVFAAACGGGGSSNAGSGSKASSKPSASSSASGAPARGNADLVIWTDPLKITAVKKVADAFGKANGITVNVQAVSSDLQTAFVTANAAGNGPDVVVGAHDWIGNLVQNGAIDPLQLTPTQLQGYAPQAVKATTYNNKLYGVPYGIEALGLYRNTAVAPTKPTTMNQAISEGEAAKKAGKVQSALNLPVGDLGDAYHMEPIYTSWGGYMFGLKPNGEYNPQDLGVGKPGSIAAAKEIGSLGEKGSDVLRRSIDATNSIPLFGAGKAAFLISGPWALPDLAKTKVKFAVQPVPGFKGEKAAQPFMGAQAFMVAANAKNKAFAQEFVTTGVNNPTAMKTLYELTRLPPAMLSVQKQVTDPNIKIFAQLANKSAPMPAIPQMASVWAPLGKAYSAIVGGANPTTTMTQTGQTIQKAIGN